MFNQNQIYNIFNQQQIQAQLQQMQQQYHNQQLAFSECCAVLGKHMQRQM